MCVSAHLSGSSQDGTVYGDPPGSTVKLRSSLRSVSVAVVEGVTAACPSSPPTSALWPLPAKPHLIRFPGWWRHIVHHHRPVWSGEHHRGRPGPRAETVRTSGAVELLRHGGVALIAPGRTPQPHDRRCGRKSVAVRQRDWRLTRGLSKPGWSTADAGGSAVVAAETTAIVRGRLELRR